MNKKLHFTGLVLSGLMVFACQEIIKKKPSDSATTFKFDTTKKIEWLKTNELIEIDCNIYNKVIKVVLDSLIWYNSKEDVILMGITKDSVLKNSSEIKVVVTPKNIADIYFPDFQKELAGVLTYNKDLVLVFGDESVRIFYKVTKAIKEINFIRANLPPYSERDAIIYDPETWIFKAENGFYSFIEISTDAAFP